MRDINHDRSIRNIPVPASHRRVEERQPAPRPPRRSKKKWLMLLTAVLFISIAIGAALIALYSDSKVEVYARTAQVEVPEEVVARLSAPVGSLAYEYVSVTRSATTSVPANGTKQVSRQASGLITISNTGGTTQRLISGTRFQAGDGKIYKIAESIVVPAGSTAAPGTIAVSVFAESPGADYNRTGATSFTLPAFKGDPRFTRITARSEGEIKGGFVGVEPSVAEADFIKAKTTLQKDLDSQLRALILSSIPEGYLTVPGTLEVSYADIVQSADGNSARISQSATIRGAVVRANDLASWIASQTVGEYDGEAVGFKDASAFTMEARLASSTEQTLRIRLAGTPTLVWQFDPVALKQALLGKEKSEFQDVIKSFKPAIAEASAVIRPFWLSTFPTQEDKLTITIQTK